MSQVEQFNKYRSKMNEKILSSDSLIGFSTAEVNEAMGVATLVGGTIVIPHLRRAYEYWEELQNV